MNKWLRRALLGGVAMTVLAAGAQADELSALKAQLEALQARVATIETRGATLPEGVSLVTFERGQQAGALKDELFDNALLDRAPDSRGMTISVTPTADLPAPVASIELSGYVRTRVLWLSSDGNTNNATGTSADVSDFDLTARGQIDVAATVDTAVGRVTGGLQFRGDFGSGAAANTNTQLRTAWARWQMTDALSLTFGHTGQIASLSNVSSTMAAIGPTPFGPDNTRRSQVRLTFAQGPFNFRFGVEDGSQSDRGNNNSMFQGTTPDFAASMGIDMGMVGFRAGGEVGKVFNNNGSIRKTGFVVNAGMDFDLGSMATFNTGFVYSKGMGCDGLVFTGHTDANNGNGVSCLNGNQRVKVWAAVANLNITMTETTSLALSGGYFNASNDPNWDKGYSIGSALVWKPVDALQFGVAGDYRVHKHISGRKDKDLVFGLAGWFFF